VSYFDKNSVCRLNIATDDIEWVCKIDGTSRSFGRHGFTSGLWIEEQAGRWGQGGVHVYLCDVHCQGRMRITLSRQNPVGSGLGVTWKSGVTRQ
jgi:hypothetical protein